MVIKAQNNEQSNHYASFPDRYRCSNFINCMVLLLDKEK